MLTASDRSKSLEFRLAKPAGRAHEDWLTYQIILTNEDDTRFVFPTNPRDLAFLDAFVQPEVLLICDGIRNVVSQGGKFDFQPVDEKDFRLMVSVDGNRTELSLTFAFVSAPEDVDWAQGVLVENSDLIQFVNDLEQQYREIMCPRQRRLMGPSTESGSN